MDILIEEEKKRIMENLSKERSGSVLFNGKPRTVGNYSVSFIFKDVRTRWPVKLNPGIIFQV